MSHGHPDYGVSTVTKTVAVSTDTNELAARLGSPDAWDRRGQVVRLVNFDWGLNSVLAKAASLPTYHEWSPNVAEHGRGSFHQHIDAADFADYWVEFYTPIEALTRLGFEATISFASPFGTAYLEVDVIGTLGTATALLYINASPPY